MVYILSFLFTMSAFAYDTVAVQLGKCPIEAEILVEHIPKFDRGLIVISKVDDSSLFKYSSNEELSDDPTKKDLDNVGAGIIREISSTVNVKWWEEGSFESSTCGGYIHVDVKSADGGWTPYKSKGFVSVATLSVDRVKKCFGENYPSSLLSQYQSRCQNTYGEKYVDDKVKSLGSRNNDKSNPLNTTVPPATDSEASSR
jgi:hypothetical protein